MDAARRAPAGVYITFFGVSQILAFLYLMTNKPGLLGSIAACVAVGVLSAFLAAARLRALTTTPASIHSGRDPGWGPRHLSPVARTGRMADAMRLRAGRPLQRRSQATTGLVRSASTTNSREMQIQAIDRTVAPFVAAAPGRPNSDGRYTRYPAAISRSAKSQYARVDAGHLVHHDRRRAGPGGGPTSAAAANLRPDR